MGTRALSVVLVVLSAMITGIGWPGARAAMHAPVAQDGTLLTLRLQEMSHAPADLPPGVLTLRVPVYPHARVWRHPYAMPMFSSLSPYIKVSPQVTYELPTGPGRAKAWYLDAFSRRGYTVQVRIGGSFSGVGGNWTLLDVRPRTIPMLDLFVALQEKPGGTIVAYRASAVIVPRRAPGSYLSEGISRVTVTYQFLTGPSHTHTIARTLAKRSAIVTLVRAINALPRSTGGFLSCPQIDRQATLVFVSSGGRSVTARTDPGCTGVVIAGYPPLAGSIWPLLSSLVPPGHS